MCFLLSLYRYVINFGKMNERIANLPRKWNVCVVGSHDLYEHPHINDLAYMPAEKSGKFGYNLLVGGFFSATACEEAISMDAWVPEEHVIHACDAILTTFRDFGARSGRQKCRCAFSTTHNTQQPYLLLKYHPPPPLFSLYEVKRPERIRLKHPNDGKLKMSPDDLLYCVIDNSLSFILLQDDVADKGHGLGEFQG